MIKCCICGREIPEFQSNNPAGAAWKKDGKVEFIELKLEDRCCDECNQKFVIPGRIYKLKLEELKRQQSDKTEE